MEKKEGKTENGLNNTVPSEDNNGNSTKTLNGIEINANGVKVNSAFLSSESGTLIPSGNTVRAGEIIKLVINVDGWEVVDGKTFLGASETITSDNGTVQMETGDMFAAYSETGFDAADSKNISLNASMNGQPAAIEYYITNFRIWDKKGSGEIKGNYKFYVK